MTYVPSRTKDLDQHNLRILKKINYNISERYQSLKQNVNHSRNWIKEIPAQNSRVDEYPDSYVYTPWKYAIKNSNNVLTQNFILNDPQLDIGTGLSSRSEIINPPQISVDQLADSLKQDHICFTQHPRVFAIKIREAFSHLFRPDKFNEFLVLKYENTAPRQLDEWPHDFPINIELKQLNAFADMKVKAKILYQNDLIGVFDHELDTLYSFSKMNGSGVIDKILAGKSYRLYFQELDLDDQTLVLCGLIDSGKFNNDKSQVSLTVLILLIVVALLITLTLPALKLSISNRYERTNKNDVFGVSLTTMISIGLVNLFIFFTFYNIRFKQHVKINELEVLADSIESKFSTETEKLLSQIETLNQVIQDFPDRSIKPLHQNLFNDPQFFSFASHNMYNENNVSTDQFTFNESNFDQAVSNLPARHDPKYFIDQINSLDDKFSSLLLLNSDLFLEYDSIEKKSKNQFNELLNTYENIKVSIEPTLIEANQRKKRTTNETSTLPEKFKSTQRKLGQLTKYPYLHYAFYNSFSLVQNYRQDLKWNTNDKLPTLIQDLRDRNYINSLNDQTAWLFPNFESQYYLEPVFSKTTGKVSTEISMSNGGLIFNGFQTNISVISTKLSSFSKPIIPKGLEFAVIDRKGEVKYHIDERYVLQENFLDECNNIKSLKAAINTKSSRHGETNYHSRGIQFYIKPIKHTDYFLITYKPVRIHNYILLHSISSSFILFTLIIGLLLLLCYFQHLMVLPKYQYIRRSYFLDWLRPKSSQKFVNNCIILFFTQFIVTSTVFLFGFFIPCSSPLYGTFVVFITPILLFPFSYYMLSMKSLSKMSIKMRIRHFLPTTFVILIVNSVLSLFYDESIFLFLILVLFELVVITLTSLLISSKRFEALAINTTRLWGKLHFKQNGLTKLTNSRYKYYPYYLLLTLWMMFIAVTPTTVFIHHFYMAEMKLFIAHQEMNMAQKIKDKYLETSRRWKDVNLLNEPSKKWEYINQDCTYKLGPIEVENFLDSTYSNSDPIPLKKASILKIMSLLRPDYDYYSHETEQLFQDSEKIWTSGDTIYYQDDFYCQECPENFIRLSSRENYIVKSKFWVKLIAIVTLIGFIVLIFLLMKFLAKRLFAIDSIIQLQVIENTQFQLSCYQSILLWYPKQELPERVQPLIKDRTISYLDRHLNDPKKLVSIFNDQLKKINKEINFRPRTILQSSYNKSALDEYINDQLEICLEINKESWKETKYVWDRLKPLLIEVSVPIQNSIRDQDETKILAKSIILKTLGDKSYHYFNDKELLIKQLENELKQDENLLHVGQDIYHQIRSGEKVSFERMILMISHGASQYYHILWNHCSKIEKFILYDLAVDGYINTQNKSTILKLCQKGLVTYENSLQVMNASFRNYVVENMEPVMIKEINKNVSEKGRWSKFKTPLILFLVAIAGFIFITQEEVFTKSVAFLTTLLTILPALLRFLPTSRVAIPPPESN